MGKDKDNGTPALTECQKTRNGKKLANAHSVRVGVPWKTGRQPSQNDRIPETEENMQLPRTTSKHALADA